MRNEEFIKLHESDDVRQLALKAHSVEGIDLPYCLDQIAGRQTARRKLPSWAAVDSIVYPPHISMEQCSSEQTAMYKKSVLDRLHSSFFIYNRPHWRFRCGFLVYVAWFPSRRIC